MLRLDFIGGIGTIFRTPYIKRYLGGKGLPDDVSERFKNDIRKEAEEYLDLKNRENELDKREKTKLEYYEKYIDWFKDEKYQKKLAL